VDTYVGVIMTTCPSTGREFETGIETDRRTFELTPAFVARSHCPLCGMDHVWSRKDAWLCETMEYPDILAVQEIYR
jgi:hypothetical protein